MKVGIYRHYKGQLYLVICVGKHTETGEQLVVYQSLYGNYELWVRPLSMFIEDVLVDGENVPRFTFMNNPLEHTDLILE